MRFPITENVKISLSSGASLRAENQQNRGLARYAAVSQRHLVREIPETPLEMPQFVAMAIFTGFFAKSRGGCQVKKIERRNKSE